MCFACIDHPHRSNPSLRTKSHPSGNRAAAAAMALLASAAKTALRRTGVQAAAAGQAQRRGLSWVKDVTVNVTFVNHEVRGGQGWIGRVCAVCKGGREDRLGGWTGVRGVSIGRSTTPLEALVRSLHVIHTHTPAPITYQSFPGHRCRTHIHTQHTTQGLRITVPGRVGQSLLDVAQMHDVSRSSRARVGGFMSARLWGGEVE